VPDVLFRTVTLLAVGILSALRGDDGSAEKPAEVVLEKAVLEIAALSANEEIFQERIAELELALEDREWTKMAGGNEEFQFTRTGLDDIIHMSRLYYLKNPVIKRPVDLQAVYVWGQGVSIHAEGAVDEVVQGFLADPSNRRSFCGHDALMDSERRMRVEGNLFLRFFINPTSGRVQVRRLPVEEIRAVIFNPEDHDEPWFYLRAIKRKGQKDKFVAYPDWRYARMRKLEKDEARGAGISMDALADYEDAVIEWETPVMHRKVGGFGDMDFGVPETYAAIDWARAYKSALEDYKKTVKSLATWAWKMKMGGGQTQLNAAAAALGTTFGTTNGTDQWTEENPTPTAGSLMGLLGDNDLRAIDVSKAAVDPDGFRRLLLMAASAMGMPEIYYGAAEGSFATAKSMDRPTELQFRDRQALWSEILIEVLTIAVEAAATAPKNGTLSSAGYDDITGLMKLRAGGKDIELEIDVDFPPILQKDPQEYLQALTTFTTQNGQAVQALNDGPTLYRMALTALGVDNVEEVIDKFYPKDGGEPETQPIVTYEAPKSPAEVELENEDNAKLELDKIAAQKAMLAQGPLGNQPTAQGPAGAGNKAPVGRGGANAVAPPAARESESDIDEAQARIEFMRSLMEMRREVAAGKTTNHEQ